MTQIIYVSPILEHQRVYDVLDKRTHNDVSVIHVIQKDGVYWGCVHEPRVNNLKRNVPIQGKIPLNGELVEFQMGNREVNVPVYVESKTWMSVHRTSEFETWVKDFGTDDTYYLDLKSLGIQDEEFRYMRNNRTVEPHVNSIPKPPAKPQVIEVYIPTPTRMTPQLLIATMADGWTEDGKAYWFGTRDTYQAAIAALHKAYPPKRKRSKSPCSVPYMTGQGMGYDESSQSKSHMRMGWYIKIL